MSTSRPLVTPSLIVLASMAACAAQVGADDASATATPSDDAVFVAAIAESRDASGALVFEVEAAVDGNVVAAFVIDGVVVGGGESFELAIDAEDDPRFSADLRLAGGSLFQRGAAIDQVIPEAAGRWVDVGIPAELPAFGLIGPHGIGVWSLFDDLEHVSVDADGVAVGSLGSVDVGGGQIGSVDQATFEAHITGGAVEQFTLTITDGTGVELTFDLSFEPASASTPPIEPPADDEIYDV